MKPTTLLIVPALLLSVSCGGKGTETYPDVTAVPERPEADLSAERREALAEELQRVREDAVRYATEGRPDEAPEASDVDAPDVVGDEAGNEDTGTVGDSQSE